MSSATRTFRLSVSPAATGGAWFPTTALQWNTLSGAKISDASVWNGNMPDTAPNSVLLESGAVVDQSTLTMMFAGNGGHDDGYGNEGYAIDFRANSPNWVRLNDRSPQEQFQEYQFGSTPGAWDQNYSYFPTATNIAATSLDGRPRAMHTANTMQFANGRIWYPLQTSVASKPGNSTVVTVSFDANLCRNYRAANGSPYPYSTSEILPWRIHSPLNGYESTPASSVNSNFAFGPSAIDSNGNIWYIQKSGRFVWKLDPLTATSTRYNISPTWDNMGESWVTLIPGGDWETGGDVIVTHAAGNSVLANAVGTNVRLLRLSKIPGDLANAKVEVATNAASFNWGNQGDPDGNAGPEPVQPFAGYAQNWGAVWHQSSTSVLAYNNDRRTTFVSGELNDGVNQISGWTGQQIRKLKIPMSGGRIVNPATSAPWQWSTVTLTTATPQALPQRGDHVYGTFGRFNLLKDVGGAGNDALVLMTDTNYPTYVARLPNGDF